MYLQCLVFIIFVVLINTFCIIKVDATPAQAQDLKCKDQNGNNVEWFVIYKLPKLPSPNPNIHNGTGWAYFGPNDDDDDDDDWSLSSLPISSIDSVAGQTISPLYQNDKSNLAYIVYNDQPPNSSSIPNNGHTKGLILANAQSGLWILHSIPHFPFSLNNPSSFYPTTGYNNGQLFLCLSLKTSQLDTIVGEILKYTRPYIFNYSIQSGMESAIPKLASVAKNNARITVPPWFKLFTLPIGNKLDGTGFQFQIFAKGPKSRQEIYSEWIAPKLQTSLNVQSWLNGANPLPSNCSNHNYSTYNILMKSIDDEQQKRSLNFSTHQDHSKWAVGEDERNPWTCLADLNRMEHQLVRGGASLCTSNIKFWKLFSKLVKDLQPCPRSRSRSVNN